MKNLVTGIPKGERELELHTKTSGNTENNLTLIVMSLVISAITWIFTIIFYHLYIKHSGDTSLSSHYSKLMILFAIGALISTFTFFFALTRFLNGKDRVLENDNTFEELQQMGSSGGEDVKRYPLITSIKLLIKSDELTSKNSVENKSEDNKVSHMTDELSEGQEEIITKDKTFDDLSTPSLEKENKYNSRVNPTSDIVESPHMGATIFDDDAPININEEENKSVTRMNGATYKKINNGEDEIASNENLRNGVNEKIVEEQYIPQKENAPLTRKDARAKKQSGGLFAKGKYGK